MFKNLEKKRGGPVQQPAITNGPSGNGNKDISDTRSEQSAVVKTDPAQAAEVQRLNFLVKQRDNEIGILLNYLNKKKEQGNVSMDVTRPAMSDPNSTKDSLRQDEESKQGTLFQMMSGQKQQPAFDKSIKERRIEFELNQSNAQASRPQPQGGAALQAKVDQMLTGPVHLTMEDLADRAKGFEKFRKSYRKNEAMEDNRNLLKEKYARGKYLGQEVNNSRGKIKKYSSQIEEIRK